MKGYLKLNRQGTCNLMLSRLRATIIAVDKQYVSHIMTMFL